MRQREEVRLDSNAGSCEEEENKESICVGVYDKIAAYHVENVYSYTKKEPFVTLKEHVPHQRNLN